MNQTIKMALKDLKLLFRDKMGAFFIVGFPVLMGLFFGLIMGGNSGSNSAAMKIAVVDQDDSEFSKKFIDSLKANKSIELELLAIEPAKDSVRKGSRVGMIVVPAGFGETAGVFWQEAPEIQLGMDPSRTAEAGMMQGFIMEAIGGLAGDRFNNPKEFRPFIKDSIKDIENDKEANPIQRGLLKTMMNSFLSVVDSMDELQKNDAAGGDGEEAAGSTNFEFANITALDITRDIDPNSVSGQLKKVRSKWDISFPQTMMWGVMGCVAGFAISIARENTLGTMLRLQAAPISRFQILAGKALACFLTVIGVIIFLTLVGMALGMQPGSYPKLAIAALCVAFCFVGIMMTMSVLGRTEQSVSGSGWAINMVMAMIGGCMVPVMFMPQFIQSVSVLSPIKWAILAIEGAIWRDFTFGEMLMPCAILIGVGALGLVVGTAILNKRGLG